MDTIIASNSIPSYAPSSSPSLPVRTNTSIHQLPSTSFAPSNQKKLPLFLGLQSRRRKEPVVTLRSRHAITCGVVGGGDGGVVTEIHETQFSETVLKSDRPVLVEFVANWCGPCRLISPVIQWAAQEYKDKLTVVKIDHDANPRLIEQYKVYGLPTLILFKSGKEVPESRREGAITKVKLKEYLDALLESISVT